jgi:hypothetical protein
MTEKKEMSQLQRQLLGGGGAITLFTQQEFDEAMDVEQGKIMVWAMDAAKMAVELEREKCAKIAEDMDLPLVAEAIRKRMDKKEAPSEA